MDSLSTSKIFFSLKTYVAAMLALYTAFCLDLQHPYWTLMSAYILSQPLAGAVRSKGVYRIYGTLLGGAVSIAVVPNFVNTPLLLSLILALWISACLYISVLDRTPRSYAFLLAGYTASIVGLPNVDIPNDIFNESVSRFEEISLGIIFTMVMHTLVFPQSITNMLKQRLDAWWNNTRKLMKRAFLQEPRREQVVDWQNLANEITQLYLLSTHLAFDTSHLQNPEYVMAVDERMSNMLTTLYVLTDRLNALREHNKSSKLIELALQRIKQLSDDNFDPINDVTIDEKIEQLTPKMKANSSWYEILQMSLAVNLKKLITIYTECSELLSHRYSEGKSRLQHIDLQPSYKNNRPLHRDHSIAFASALATFSTIMTITIFWIASAWPHGNRAALYGGIISCLFSSLPNSVGTIIRALFLFIITTPIDAFYLFAVFTRVEGFIMLALVLAPPFLFYGYLLAIPRLAAAGSAGALAFLILSSIQNGYNSEFADFLNASLALNIGIIVAAFFNYIFRSPSVEASVRHLISAIARDLSAIASQKKPVDSNVFTIRTEDRIGLLIPIMNNPSEREAVVLQGMKDLSVGVDIINLKSAIAELPETEAAVFSPLLHHIANYFSQNTIEHSKILSIQFLQQIDHALSKVTAMSKTSSREKILLGLCGLRRNIFSAAPPYQPDSQLLKGT